MLLNHLPTVCLLCLVSAIDVCYNRQCFLEGIKIVGGLLDWEVSEKNYGIFVKKVLSGGLAAADGQYQ